jgi:hypothetical protein
MIKQITSLLAITILLTACGKKPAAHDCASHAKPSAKPAAAQPAAAHDCASHATPAPQPAVAKQAAAHDCASHATPAAKPLAAKPVAKPLPATSAEKNSAAGITLSPEAMHNYGIVFGKVTTTNYTACMPVLAQVAELPGSELVVTAPLGGRVAAIQLLPGEFAKPGTVVMRLVRDPIAPPELTLVKNFLQPDMQALLEAAAACAKERLAYDTAKDELRRLSAAQLETEAGSLIPKKTMLELEAQVKGMEKAVAARQQTLAGYGYSAAAIDRLLQGGTVAPTTENWVAALQANGYWPETAAAAFAALPAETQANPWSAAALGELQARGLLNPAIAAGVKAEPVLARRWVEAASLMLQGLSFEAARQAAVDGWLEPIVEIKPPALAAGRTIESIAVKVGAQVHAGDQLLIFADSSRMQLLCRPIGDEIGMLEKAAQSASELSAIPLIKGGGPALAQLRVAQLSGSHEESAVASLLVPNMLLADSVTDGRTFHNWQLRPGMKYLLQVPVKQFADVFVVPNEAVVDAGSDKVVIVKACSYTLNTVTVLWQDEANTVIATGGALKHGMTIATAGAFQLHLAVQKGSGQGGAVDPHAGCNH